MYERREPKGFSISIFDRVPRSFCKGSTLFHKRDNDPSGFSNCDSVLWVVEPFVIWKVKESQGLIIEIRFAKFKVCKIDMLGTYFVL